MSPSFGSGLKSCQMISSPYISTPSSFHSCEMSPFGSGGCRRRRTCPSCRPAAASAAPCPRPPDTVAARDTGLQKSPSAARSSRRSTKFVHRLRRERRRLHGQQHVVLLRDRLRRIDFDDVVLLLQLRRRAAILRSGPASRSRRTAARRSSARPASSAPGRPPCRSSAPARTRSGMPLSMNGITTRSSPEVNAAPEEDFLASCERRGRSSTPRAARCRTPSRRWSPLR